MSSSSSRRHRYFFHNFLMGNENFLTGNFLKEGGSRGYDTRALPICHTSTGGARGFPLSGGKRRSKRGWGRPALMSVWVENTRDHLPPIWVASTTPVSSSTRAARRTSSLLPCHPQPAAAQSSRKGDGNSRFEAGCALLRASRKDSGARSFQSLERVAWLVDPPNSYVNRRVTFATAFNTACFRWSTLPPPTSDNPLLDPPPPASSAPAGWFLKIFSECFPTSRCGERGRRASGWKEAQGALAGRMNARVGNVALSASTRSRDVP